MSNKDLNKNIPYSPTRKELYKLYPNISTYSVDISYKQIRKEFKNKYINSNCLTNIQFIEFIKEFGLPNGFEKSDFPFLNHIADSDIL